MFQEILGNTINSNDSIDCVDICRVYCKPLCTSECYEGSNAAMLVYDKVEIRLVEADNVS